MSPRTAILLSIYRSPVTTGVFLLAYFSWIAAGWSLSVHRQAERFATVPIIDTLVKTRTDLVTLSGTAGVRGLTQNCFAPPFLGEFVLESEISTRRVLRLRLHWEGAGYSDQLKVTRPDGSVVYTLEKPINRFRSLNIPLPAGSSRFVFQATSPTMRTFVQYLSSWIDTQAVPKVRDEVEWTVLKCSSGNRIGLGGGWYIEYTAISQGKDELVPMSEVAHFLIEAPATGRYRFELPFVPASGDYPPPVVQIDGMVVTAQVEPGADLQHLVFEADVAPLSVISLALDAPIHSSLQDNGGPLKFWFDRRFISFLFRPLAFQLSPVKEVK